MKAQRRERHGNREQGPENRDQELGFVILNEVTRSVLRKNLNLCQQEAYNVLCALLRSGDNTPFELKLVTVFAVLQLLAGRRGNRPLQHKNKHIFPY